MKSQNKKKSYEIGTGHSYFDPTDLLSHFMLSRSLGSPPMASPPPSPLSGPLPPLLSLYLSLYFSLMEEGVAPKVSTALQWPPLVSPLTSISFSSSPSLASPSLFSSPILPLPCFHLHVSLGLVWSSMGAYRSKPPVGQHRFWFQVSKPWLQYYGVNTEGKEIGLSF